MYDYVGLYGVGWNWSLTGCCYLGSAIAGGRTVVWFKTNIGS